MWLDKGLLCALSATFDEIGHRGRLGTIGALTWLHVALGGPSNLLVTSLGIALESDLVEELLLQVTDPLILTCRRKSIAGDKLLR